jgi:hypothetical protein
VIMSRKGNRSADSIMPMEIAPSDRSILLHLADGACFAAHMVPVHGEGGTNWVWAAADENEAPEDWCDGICWARNSAGQPSTRPIGWSEIVVKEGTGA